MSQASQQIAQQYVDGGVVPAQLNGQSSVSKKYVDDQLTIRDGNIADVSGTASATQAEVGQLKRRVDRIIADAGSGNPEIVDARGNHQILKDRLDASDAMIADLAMLGVNVCSAPYNADPTGNDDCTEAFNTALADHMRVYVPEGKYKINGTVKMDRYGQKLIGSGTDSTTLIANNANLPLIEIKYGMVFNQIKGMSLDRSGAATSGGTGIRCAGLVSYIDIEDLYIKNQFRGLHLGGTDFSKVNNVIVTACYADGIYMTNLSEYGNCQWQFNEILLSANNGSGMAIRSVTGAPGMSLGKITKLHTFGNSGSGISVIANPLCPISGLRVDGCFLGADGFQEINLNTYGGMHVITNSFFEYAGTQTTGRESTTPASNVGSGVFLGENNTDCLISNCYGTAMADNGVTSFATDVTIASCNFNYCGQGSTSSYKNGIGIYAGSALITGVRARNNQYGLLALDGSSITLNASDLRNNTNGSTYYAANSSSVVSSGNRL